ncbi:hypothetical protein ACFWWT_46125 [Streptomyces sp. NPDC058676]|uniref:hypothetical protein n=1 Tax=unclassified Streptomyces TaxID=2593676 RepID=UPI00364EBACC
MRRFKADASRPARTLEEILATAGEELRARRRPFDEAAGLRRLARPSEPAPLKGAATVTRARHQLSVMTSLFLRDQHAPAHIGQLAARLGDDGDDSDGGELAQPPCEDLDLDGAHLFGCMLHLAGHPLSAQFWWELAAGADHVGAVYCLYLHHLGQGAGPEALHWIHSLRWRHADIDEVFLLGTGRFMEWMYAHRPPTAHPDLLGEVVRLALREDDRFLVCRPERQLADRLKRPS